jgi:hypothetical protein
MWVKKLKGKLKLLMRGYEWEREVLGDRRDISLMRTIFQSYLKPCKYFLQLQSEVKF